MNFIKKALFVMLIFAIQTCEKDDICAASETTTPRLIISFNDNLNQDELKNVTGFVATGIGQSNPLSDYNNITTSEVILPLKTDETSTQYELYKDFEIDDNGTPDDTSDDIQLGNPDVITINYTINTVFVSNACGFKAQFENVSITIETDTDNWLFNSEAINDNLIISDETTTHFKLYH